MKHVLPLVVLLAVSVRAHAQDPCADPAAESCALARAEAAFLRGDTALRELRFADARDAFLRSLEHAPRLGAAYNLGHAYRGTGQLLEAIAIWGRLLDGEFGALGEAERADVQTFLNEIRDWPAELCLRVRGPAQVRLSLNSEAQGDASTAEPICERVNPGQVHIRLEAEGYTASARSVSLERSERQVLTVALIEAPTLSPPPESRRVVWPWIVAGVVLVGAGVAIAVWQTRPETPSFEPIGRVQALHAW